ncbi:hypothetical protein Tco_0538017 [Tanacetum coccineum]
MSSITAQQTKLDLELVPKENRIDIGKCNGRIPRGLTPKEPTFQVVLDAIAVTPCYPAFLITTDVPEICPRVQDQDFDALPTEEDTVSFLRDLGHTGDITSLNDVVVDQMHDLGELLLLFLIEAYQERLVVLTSFVSPKHKSFVTLSWRNKIGMHTSKDDYLINTLRFVSRKEASQIYGAVLPECLTSPEMKESKAYKTYLGYATGAVPPKIARKFKKASPTKKDNDLVPVDEEPVQKGKRVKRSAKKSSTTPAAGIVIRETPVKTKSTGKEKVDVSRGKGIDLLSEVALAEKAQLKEIEKITPTVTSEGTDDKPGVPDVTEDDSTESESESWGNDEDDNNDEQELKDESSEQENESEVHESDDSEQEDESDNDNQEEEEVNQENEYEDDDIEKSRLEEPTQTGKEVVQGEGADSEMIDAQQGNENLETTQEQVVEDAYGGRFSTVQKKTEFLLLLIQHETQRLDKPEKEEEFMNFLSESLTARIKEQVKDQLPQILPKEVSNFASPVIEKLIKESHDEVTLAKVSSQPQSSYEAASTLTEFELKKILLDKMEKKCNIRMKRGRKDKDKDKDPSAGLDRGHQVSTESVQSEEPVFEVADSDMPQDQEGNLGDNEDEPRKETASRRDWFKKPTPPQEPTDPDWNIGKTTQEGPTQNWLMTLAASTSTDKSLKDFDELMSTPIDFSGYILNGLKIENLTQEILLGPAFRLLKGTRSNYAELEYDFEECYKALSEKLDWENPEGGDYPFDLSKPLPLITRGNHQRVPFEFFINNDLKYLQGGVSTMTYTTSTTKSKATKYDLPGIEDMVPNIWSPVKVAYDRYALWGISHWRQQRKSFYAYARGMQSRGDVYSTKRILAVTHVKVMRKHGYGLMRSDELYKFSDGTLTRLLSFSSSEKYYQEIHRHGVLAKRMEHIGKRKTHIMNQGRSSWIRRYLIPADSQDSLPHAHTLPRQSFKVKEIQERCIIKAFQDYQIKKGMSMLVQKSQVSREWKKFNKMAKRDYALV